MSHCGEKRTICQNIEKRGFKERERQGIFVEYKGNLPEGEGMIAGATKKFPFP